MAFTTSQQHNFSNEYCELPILAVEGLRMWYDEDIGMVPRHVFESYVSNYMVPNIVSTVPDQYDIISTSSGSPSLTSFPERLGVSDLVVVPEINAPGLYTSLHHQVDDEYTSSNAFASNFCSLYDPPTIHNWEMKDDYKREEAGIEEVPGMKIGKYSMEERKEKIIKYLKKRNLRNFNKTIKYACRKTLADKRVRIRGRFAKNNEAASDHDNHQILHPNQSTNSDSHDDEDNVPFYGNDFPVKQDNDQEEEWLQEAMSSLLYSPYNYNVTMPIS